LAIENPQRNGLAGATTDNLANTKGRIVDFSFWLLKQGYSQATIKGRVKLLNRLMRLGANFDDEESIKRIIAQQQWSVSRKVNAVDAYDSLLKMQNKTWTPPIYRRVRKLPFIPTEMELDQLIAGCSKKVSTFLQLLKETGMRCGEACQLLKWTDIDLEQRSIRITPEKGSTPRILPISAKLIDMLNGLPKNTSTVFGSSDLIRRNFNKQRKRLVFKLKNPRINQITFHTFRHWKATMEYHKTRDILHVKEILGHKSLNNTMLYTQLVNFQNDDYTAAIAHCEEEACKLIEAGFEFVCDFNGNKLFRKRK
jgi:integrase